MHALNVADSTLMLAELPGWLWNSWLILKVVIGFSVIIFVHELGHFLAAKWMGVRVERFAVGFFYRLFGYRKGEGFTFGPRPNYTAEDVKAKGLGETDYCFNALPFGGYVRMLGQDDIVINEETGEVKMSDDPRSFTNKPVWRRMVVVSAGVVFNVIFALLLYIFVFMTVGRAMMSPVIGHVEPGSPAAAAGLLGGDRVLSINDKDVRSFDEIGMAWMLSDGPMRFTVERNGTIVDHPLVVDIDRDPESGDKEMVGIAPLYTTEIGVGDPNAAPDELQPGDRITHVNGEPVDNAFEIVVAFQRSGGEPLKLTIERPNPDNPGQTETLTISQRPRLQIEAPDPRGTAEDLADRRHLLGFCRRRFINAVVPDTPAEKAGFKAGDVIVQWGTVPNPLYGEIKDSIDSHNGKPVKVVVERDGENVPLTVTPQSPVQLFGTAPPRVGVEFAGEEDRAIVAAIIPDTPAAKLGMPRGARIVSIADTRVTDWFEVYDALQRHAGESVSIRYETGSDEVTGTLAIPSSVVNELDLPPTALITEIAGQDQIEVEPGQRVALPSPFAVAQLLEQHVGETISVKYLTSLLDHEPQAAQFTVTAENTDPWQLRVLHRYELLSLSPETETVMASNPIEALQLSGQQTFQVLFGVYRVLQNMLTQNVGVQHVTGPVGIFRHAFRQAESGLGELLFFLAFISINLAVLNFLPLPVVDGGLMVFLIIEWIRGKPLSIKVQVITTLTGLALIVICFLYVTLQDIVKWWGGNL